MVYKDKEKQKEYMKQINREYRQTPKGIKHGLFIVGNKWD